MEKALKLSLIAVSAIFISMGYAEESPQTHEKAEKKEVQQHKGHAKHWGYNGEVGPENWGKLDAKFHMCSEGKQQCPIDVVPTKDANLSPLDLNYTKESKSVVDNGHAVQVNMQEGNIFVIDGEPYELKQFHFHTPSENHIKGKSFPMEAHFVHASKDGNLAVIAVMFVEGDANPTLDKIEKEFPLEHNKAKDLNFSKESLGEILPKDKDYYKFMGSLTTPPCSEDVKWFVFKNPVTASKEQIEAMHKQINKENNRPIQPTNGREILE